MIGKRTAKIIWFLIVLGMCIVVVKNAGKSCMGLTLVTEEELEQYSETLEIDISGLRFNGEKVAADLENNTIYISQSKTRFLHYSMLQGELSFQDLNCKIYFLEDSNIRNLAKTVKNGTPLSLVVVSDKEEKVKNVKVVLTTLPVISLEGEKGERDEEDRKLYNGNMIIWAGKGSITERYFMQSNFLEWRVRGGISAGQDKNQWKLTMKNENDENMNLELLGMGADDDWILNSLVFDDTKVREKLFMDTWNEVASKSDHNYKMSTGEYVEVIINGEYMGVYLLQRRLDKKYLNLSDEDVLLKVTTYQAENAEEAYELVTEVEDVEKVYLHMQKIYEGSDCSSIDVNNLADVNNMLYLTNAVDNGGLKNMYMVLENESNMYKIFFVPWDTDMILGLDWDGHIIYDYERTMEYFPCRMETTAVKNVNSLYDKIAKDRWNYLKKSTLSVEELTNKIDTYSDTLESSGALQRDKDKWGERYGGKDTAQNMKKYISERFDMLEYYYCQ